MPRQYARSSPSPQSGDAGFSLLEALIATTIVAIGAGSLLQLFILSTAANRATRAATFASTFARQKMEELRASRALATSPPGSLDNDAVGYCDLLDEAGQIIGGDSPVCGAGGSAAYVRRWSIAPSASGGLLVLQVLVSANGSAEQSRVVSARAAAE